MIGAHSILSLRSVVSEGGIKKLRKKEGGERRGRGRREERMREGTSGRESFNRFRAPRTIEASASIESAPKLFLSTAIDHGIGINRIGVEETTFVEHLDRSKRPNRSNRR